MSAPTFGSLFAGIGGFDLGLERAGWRCRWQVELDPFCQRVLAKHWPDVRRYADVREFPESDTERVDLICGGFPCQPVSDAGRRRAQADERWLWPDFLRVVRALRPRYVLVENVPGLLTANRGLAFGDVLGGLAASGFDAEWDCLRAASFGAWHERERVFIVAHADGAGRARSPLHVFQRGSLQAVSDAARAREVDAADIDETRRAHHEGRTRSAHANGRAELTPSASESRPFDWLPEPAMDRVVHGLSRDVDAVAALGNAIVPQVAEWLGRRLMQARSVAESDGAPSRESDGAPA